MRIHSQSNHSSLAIKLRELELFFVSRLCVIHKIKLIAFTVSSHRRFVCVHRSGHLRLPAIRNDRKLFQTSYRFHRLAVGEVKKLVQWWLILLLITQCSATVVHNCFTTNLVFYTFEFICVCFVYSIRIQGNKPSSIPYILRVCPSNDF